MDLQFMLSQRSKLGERGTMQIAYVDIPEAVRHATKPERRESSENPKRANLNIV